MSSLQLNVYVRHQVVYSDRLNTPLELGRQRGDEPILKCTGDAKARRLAIVPQEDTSIPRDFVRIDQVNAQTVRLTNLHSTVTVQLEGGNSVAPKASQEFTVPLLIVIGSHAVRIESDPTSQPAKYNSLDDVTIAPGSGSGLGTGGLGSSAQVRPNFVASSADSLIAWFQAVTSVLDSAGTATDFFQRAAASIVESIRLDTGAVVLWEGGSWSVAAQYSSRQAPGMPGTFRPSQTILSQVRDQKRTFWQVPTQSAAAFESLIDIQAFVAAPILNRQGEVTGVLYGDRRRSATAPALPDISRLEAQLVETLACSVAAGLVRLTEERAALSARLTFEQFFTPELSQSLAKDPNMLEGRDAEVSVLFCDIRGFSRASEQLGPTKTVEWIQSVMGALSDCVAEHHGVLVDYVGDEVMAMWGAPTAQEDHAERACRAAIDMMNCLPDLNVQWLPVLNEPFKVGIGINTGMARVGNTGSHRKFKYGPLGNTVNLASRVQGATKYLKSDLLVTEGTFEKLPKHFETRRLCSTQVKNIMAPVKLFEINPQPTEAWRVLKSRYEEALEAFEQGEYRRATGLLARCIELCPDDGPSLVLLSRVVPSLVDPDRPASVVWTLPGK